MFLSLAKNGMLVLRNEKRDSETQLGEIDDKVIRSCGLFYDGIGVVRGSLLGSGLKALLSLNDWHCMVSHALEARVRGLVYEYSEANMTLEEEYEDYFELQCAMAAEPSLS